MNASFSPCPVVLLVVPGCTAGLVLDLLTADLCVNARSTTLGSRETPTGASSDSTCCTIASVDGEYKVDPPAEDEACEEGGNCCCGGRAREVDAVESSANQRADEETGRDCCTRAVRVPA